MAPLGQPLGSSQGSSRQDKGQERGWLERGAAPEQERTLRDHYKLLGSELSEPALSYVLDSWLRVRL